MYTVHLDIIEEWRGQMRNILFVNHLSFINYTSKVNSNHLLRDKIIDATLQSNKRLDLNIVFVRTRANIIVLLKHPIRNITTNS